MVKDKTKYNCQLTISGLYRLMQSQMSMVKCLKTNMKLDPVTERAYSLPGGGKL